MYLKPEGERGGDFLTGKWRDYYHFGHLDLDKRVWKIVSFNGKVHLRIQYFTPC